MKRLPIGNDEFREIRENDYYYIDKSMFIADFLAAGDKVTLIARPRRFGKTLNMTMLREFFDINTDSTALFQGLKIMKTEYSCQQNTKPVIYMSFRNCKGKDMDFLSYQIRAELSREFNRFAEIWEDKLQINTYAVRQFKQMLNLLENRDLAPKYMTTALADLGQAVLTGIQRVAKESIFSQLNNPQIYTVMTKRYSGYFGLTEAETAEILEYYDRPFDEHVKKMYDGYLFADQELYNPWSILKYADSGFLDNYWINTSSNFLIRQALQSASKGFWDDFDKLAGGTSATVWLNLDTSYTERESNYSLWGLLVNAGYVTVTKRIDANSAVIRIPNEEVMSEFLIKYSGKNKSAAT